MRKSKINYIVLIFILAATLFSSIYFGYKQVEENRVVDSYLSSNNLTELPINKKTAIQISDQVRNDFNIDENSFVALDLANRPFLREDVNFLLTHKEGVCGEGTRVIVSLLNRLGFDATRITLYNNKLQSSHTLVSVLIDKEEFLLDSINSFDEVNQLLRNANISADDFNILHYTGNLSTRRDFVKSSNTDKSEAYKNFFKFYLLYSYEATPYAKLLSKLGFDIRVFNFGRPSHWISQTAEKPNLIMLIVSLFATMVVLFLIVRLRRSD